MVEQIVIHGQRAWLKQYGQGSRAVALALLNFVAHRFQLDALRPPPHRGGDAARETEARRLGELQAQGVNVPPVLGTGRASLVLGDNGSSFNTCLRQADAAGRDALVSAAMQAIAAAHAKGAYFGQPLPRNLTWDGQQIGFIDFEEDPLEVMDLAQAQARDWLMFGYGVARYYEDRPQRLQALMAAAMDGEQAPVLAHAHEVSGRLQRLARYSMKMGRSARALAHAILIVHGATTLGMLMLVAICFDFFSDGDLDFLQLFV
ncbi:MULTISPECIES: serine/threonine protein phosphatase [Stenotrophomonas]|uniref:serine/threonine protein phosphatase n=1 Tax=Stenotrophomonas TaxID=40323 RepID=UPI0008734674|nr:MULTISPECIES: serine/threonine protein phosphatase [Stenotrophomonas]OEZ00696.1 serine/threonine protein phosphatase [Stenotrophomonas sp. BIIR7]